MILSMVFAALPAAMMAQDDDMYFASSKQKNQQSARDIQSVNVRRGTDVYYSGSQRSVDEYNRRLQSNYEVLPADTGDIISFAPVEGVYPDSVGDFQLTRQMQRWDDYVPTTAYWEGYAQGQRDSYGWHSPWYYSSYYPWYDSWYYYDPWYYSSWHYGWYGDPWYYGWGYPYYHRYYGGWYGGWGYYHPRHYYYGGGRVYARQNGTIDRYGRTSGGSFNGNRSRGINSRGASVRSDVGRNFGSHNNERNTVRSTSSGSGNFTGSRSTSSYGGSSSGSGSFCGSRSTSSGGGFSGGGSRGGGGGGMSGGGRSGGSRR